MAAEPWIIRQLRSRPGASATAATSAIAARAARAAIRGGRQSRDGGEARRLVVCGDDPLALRLVQELITRYSADVTVIVANRRRNHAPRIARLPNVRVIEAEKLDVEAFRQARLPHADALALVKQDDVGNIHAALQAQEVNPRIRLVIRMFNMRLGRGVRRMVHDCAVLSDAAMAAPAFVSAALGEVAPVHVRVQSRTLYVARRADVSARDVVCGLARTVSVDGRPEMLPSDPAEADLVLAIANGTTVGLGPITFDDDAERPAGADGSTGDAIDQVANPSASARRTDRAWSPRRLRRPLEAIRTFVNPRLRLATLALLAFLIAGTVALSIVQHNLTWGNAAYVTVLTALGGAEPDLAAPMPVKILQALLTLVSIALIPVITATVVDAVVNARLALTHNRLRTPISDHIVVVGLGNVGTRVIRQLHALGVPVVAVDKTETALGAPLAKTLGIPLIVGDASREATLRAASTQTSRALVCLSTDDVTNLEAAIHGQAIKEDLRIVLRLFDGDFADRAERAFGIAISRSVSYVAAPEFAAAMVDRQVIGTVPIGRRVLLIAEAPVCVGSALEGRSIAEANKVGQARVVAITSKGDRKTRWSPNESYLLRAEDVLTVAATRTGLAHMLAETGDPVARDAAGEAGWQGRPQTAPQVNE